MSEARLLPDRYCHEPEGGPTMRTNDEIPRQPYAEIVGMLLAAGATIPDRVGDTGLRASTLSAELGIDPPSGSS